MHGEPPGGRRSTGFSGERTQVTSTRTGTTLAALLERTSEHSMTERRGLTRAAPSSQNLVVLFPMPNGHRVPLTSSVAVGQDWEIWIRVKKLATPCTLLQWAQAGKAYATSSGRRSNAKGKRQGHQAHAVYMHWRGPNVRAKLDLDDWAGQPKHWERPVWKQLTERTP